MPHRSSGMTRRSVATCVVGGVVLACLAWRATPGVLRRRVLSLPSTSTQHSRIGAPSPPTIFMRPHFFGAKGDRADYTFVPLVIRSVLHHNPSAHVLMLHNDPDFSLPDQPRYHGLLMDEYETADIRQLKATYQHMSTNPALYEFYSMAAYFYVASLMDAMGLENVVVVETDVLVFCDLWQTLSAHWDLPNLDAVLTKRRVMAASYVTRVYIETFVNVALAFYSEPAVTEALRASVQHTKWGGVSDMTVNAWLAKPGFVNRNAGNHSVRLAELSELKGDDGQQTLAYIDSNIRTANYSFGAFDVDTSHAELGPIKKLYDPVKPGGPPRARLQPRSRYVDMWALHFQGETKALIPSVCDKFMQLQQPLH